MAEQRKSPRYPLALHTTVVAPRDRSIELSAQLQNMSASGVLINVPAHFEIGDKIEYFVNFPTDPKQQNQVRLHCMGRVVRHAGTLSEGEHELIGATIEWYQFVREARSAESAR